MTLQALLVALANNTTVNITLLDAEGNVLITFGAAGYGSIESDLGTRVVKRITVKGAKDLAVMIEDAEP